MATVQVCVDVDVERRATEALKAEGLTVEDAFRLMLERTASTGELPFAREEFRFPEPGEDAAYDAWFKAKVQKALDDPRPGIPHAEVMERAEKRLAELLAKQHQ